MDNPFSQKPTSPEEFFTDTIFLFIWMKFFIRFRMYKFEDLK